jgi:RNA recognition motif-containing protein
VSTRSKECEMKVRVSSRSFLYAVPKDRITSTHQGYGFAEFQTEVDAEYACKILNGIKLFGKPLRINKASSDRKQVDIGANLFIGNLDSAVDERVLFETFSAFGNVVGLPKVSLCYSQVDFTLLNTSLLF